MVEVIYNGAVTSGAGPDGDAFEDAVASILAYDNASFDFEDLLNALDTDQLLGGAPALDNGTVVWSGHPQVNGQDVEVILSGPTSVTPEMLAVPDPDAALLGLLATFALDTVAIEVGGQEILGIALGPAGIVFTSGDQTIEIDLDLSATPVDLEGLFGLFEMLPAVLDSGTDQQLTDTLTALDGLGLTRLALLDQGNTVLELDLGSATPAILQIADVEIALQGTSPLTFASFAAAIDMISVSGRDVPGLIALGLTDLTVTGPNDTRFLTYDFDGPNQMVIETSADVTWIDVGNGQFDVDYNPWVGFLDLAGSYDVPQPLILDLTGASEGNGYSDAWVDLGILEEFGPDGEFTSLTFLGGSGYDSANLAAYLPTSYNFYDYTAFYEAQTEYFNNNPNPWPSVYDEDAYYAAYDDWALTYEGPAPEWDDFINPDVVDIDAFEAAKLAFDEAFIDRFGAIPTTYPDPYSDEFYTGTEQESYERYTFQPWDYTAYYDADAAWWSTYWDDPTVPRPTLLDFKLNEDKFDHDALFEAQEIYNLYSQDQPFVDTYRYPYVDENAPVLEDFLILDDPSFDAQAYLDALEAFETNHPDLVAVYEAGYPWEGDFRTSVFNSDYRDESGFNFLQPFDYTAYYDAQTAYNLLSQEERDTTEYPSLFDFTTYPDLWDYASFEAAVDAYNMASQSYPLLGDFVIVGQVTVDLGAETGNLLGGGIDFDFTLIDIDEVQFRGNYDFIGIGSDGDDVFKMRTIDVGSVDIDGAGGDGDVLDLTRLRISDNYDDPQGVTLDIFNSDALLLMQPDGSYRLFDRDAQELLVDMVDVEFIRLFTDDTRSQKESYAVSSLVGIDPDTGEDLIGTEDPDDIDGQGGDDTISGLGANDTLTGGEGDDDIDGGAGEDTALFEGLFTEYQITAGATPGDYTVVSTRSGDPGTDDLTRIEELAFADGVFDGSVFTSDPMANTNPGATWDTAVETRDIDGTLLTRVLNYDNGNTTFSLFDSGILSLRTSEDVADTAWWASIVSEFDGAGDLFRKTTIGDLGDTHVETFSNGLQTSGTSTDVADEFDWASYDDTYDPAGLIETRTITYDDGRIAVRSFTDGVAQSESITDPDNQNWWASQTRTFDSNGELTQIEITADDGRIFVNTYDGGVKTSSTVTDVDDEYGWTMYVDLFDGAGEITSRFLTYDDQRTLDRSYTDGVRSLEVATDVADEYYWLFRTYTYDAAGNLTTRETTFDNGGGVTEFF